jgi:site-specific recombinase
MVPTKAIAITFDSLKLFFNMWIRHHGMLQFIVSEKDVKFMTKFWKHLVQKVGTNLSFGIAFHPQTSGQTERVNRMLNP